MNVEEFLVVGPEYLQTLFFRCLKSIFSLLSKACRVLRALLGCLRVTQPHDHPKVEPEHHQEPSSLVCSGLLCSTVKHQEVQKPFIKDVDLQRGPELLGEFSSEPSPRDSELQH